MKQITTLVFLTMCLTACIGPSYPGSGHCNQGICVKIQVAEPVQFNQPFEATMTVTSDKDVSKMPVAISSDAPDMLIEGPQGWQTRVVEWEMDVSANRPVSVTKRLRLPREGSFYVFGSALALGEHIDDAVSVEITKAGGKVLKPGEVRTRGIPPTAIPATPGGPTLAAPRVLPGAVATPLTLVPGQTLVVPTAPPPTFRPNTPTPTRTPAP